MARATPNPRGGLNAALPPDGLPTRTFNGKLSFSIPGASFRLVEMPVSHTDGDAVVYLPQSNVLIMGDLHHSHEYPVYDTLIGCQCGSFQGNLEAYRQAMKIANDQTIIVPGHGGVSNKAELAAYVRMLEKVRSDIRALLAAGKSEDEVVAAKLLQNDHSVHPGGPDNRDSFVRQLYLALKTGNGA
jgi:glyoxylase-like metal-dependent hydrolase (beta-lactamase superfamily II)